MNKKNIIIGMLVVFILTMSIGMAHAITYPTITSCYLDKNSIDLGESLNVTINVDKGTFNISDFNAVDLILCPDVGGCYGGLTTESLESWVSDGKFTAIISNDTTAFFNSLNYSVSCYQQWDFNGSLYENVTTNGSLLVSYTSIYTGCNGGDRYLKNGIMHNVTAGNVCIDGSHLNIQATSEVFCSQYGVDCKKDYMSAQYYYVGYTDDGTGNCNTNNWLKNNDIPLWTTSSMLYKISSTERTFDSGCQFEAIPPYRTLTFGICGSGQTSGMCGNPSKLFILYVDNGEFDCADYDDLLVTLQSVKDWGHYNSISIETQGVDLSCRSQLKSDIGNIFSSVYINQYVPTYTSGDLIPIVTNGLGTAGVGFVSWIEMFILLFVLITIGSALIIIKLKIG